MRRVRDLRKFALTNAAQARNTASDLAYLMGFGTAAAAAPSNMASTSYAAAAIAQAHQSSNHRSGSCGGSRGSSSSGGKTSSSGGNNGRGSSNRRGWDWRSTTALLGAGGIGAATLVSTALCESPFSSGKSGSDSTVNKLQGALDARWRELQEDVHRHDAASPSGAAKRSPPAAPYARKAADGALEVVIPVRAEADLAAVLREVQAALAPGGSNISTSVSSVYDGATYRATIQASGGAGGTAMRAEVVVPTSAGGGTVDGDTAPERAQVVVRKAGGHGGGLTDDDVARLWRVARAANLTTAAPAPSDRLWKGPSTASPEDFFQDVFDDLLGGLQRNLTHGAMSMMEQFMRELQDAMARGPEGGGAEVDGDGTTPAASGRVFVFPGKMDGDGGAFLPPTEVRPQLDRRQLGEPRSRSRVDEDDGAGGVRGHDWGSPQAAQAVRQLRSMGAQVFPPGEASTMDWGVLAGYETQKRLLEDCLLLPLLRPEVYDELARRTRRTYATNRPRAVLFEGPPGTGKTTSARILATQAAVPLVYLPLEAVLSKWYGESEQLLGKVFKAAEALGGAIIFLDEIDAIGASRDGAMHEASRRLLSVLLREMEGFDANKRTVVIGATNRKCDLDAALVSRFDLTIKFDEPDEPCRKEIIGQYAQQLSDAELELLAKATPGLTGRDLRDVCEQTERRWASKIVRKEAKEGTLPTVEEYRFSARERMREQRERRDVFGGHLLGDPTAAARQLQL